ncbi:MAG: glycosyltransferase family 2 protein [Bacteroidota bacterium]
MSSNSPVVSVILPCYNAEMYIPETLSSILNQTFSRFECLVIDDASTDRTCTLVDSIAMHDERVVLIKKEKNTGYTESLNMGIRLARGKYIARMDADDLAMPERLEKQVAYMEANPDCVVCGTAYKLHHNGFTIYPPVSHHEIMLGMMYGNVFCHPSILMRTSVLAENGLLYDTNYEPSEDYDMWVRLSRYGKLANLPDVLLSYRLHLSSVSSSRSLIQKKKAEDIRLAYIRTRLILFTGSWVVHVNRFWFSVILLVESVFNRKVSFTSALRKVIGTRSAIFKK